MDLACSLALFIAVAVVGVAYVIRLTRTGRARHDRVDAEGDSAIVAKGAMEMFYWAAQPFAVGLARCGISANAVTWGSLAIGLGAGIALAMGHFGLGAALAVAAAVCDAVDGLIARHTRSASDSGEVLDAAVDRYVELAFLAGLAIHFRESIVWLSVTLAAIVGSFMVSYSTAKAEALHVTPPRGSMRRLERALLLIVGVALGPIVAFFRDSQDIPILIALVLIATLANISAAVRLARIAADLRRRPAEAEVATQPEDDVAPSSALVTR